MAFSVDHTNIPNSAPMEPLPLAPPPHHHLPQLHDPRIPFGLTHPSPSSSIPGNYLSKDSGAYDLAENSSSGMRPPTLNIFPSQPMHVDPPSSKASMELVSPQSSGSKRPSEPSMELAANPQNEGASAPQSAKTPRESTTARKGPTSSSEQEGPKTPDPKTLRRLAQNREAARKSRLRKKAYVQQLETSRMRLNQLEQELQRARAQAHFWEEISKAFLWP
ncbi:bZIP transcription factor TGA10 isoform X1 [Senna tora]|uniref:BZIP transcription factor TGA10 isoform X1 n=1 Tax=Senna tora TaxID=362788 RepID=A0A834TDH8_9FABA|nr:bZIP transcription factor TGA10 isoform X1 [Senna tora]